MSKEERFIYHCDNYDYDEIIYDTKKGYDYVSLQTVAKTLNKQDQRIADLEAKLAKRDEFLKIAYEDIDELQKENDKLEQQLVSNSKWLKLLDKQSVQIRNHNQDKIELLEKVLTLVKNVPIEDTQYDCYNFQETTRDRCAEVIDTLIRNISEVKE